MTTQQGSAGQATATTAHVRRSPAELSVDFAPLAIFSLALTLIGFHADALTLIIVGASFSLPYWVLSTLLVGAMWVIAAARTGFHLPIATSSVAGALLIVALFAWTALQTLFSSGPMSGVAGPTEIITGLAIFLVLATLVAQMQDVERLNRLTFLIGVAVSAAFLLAVVLDAAVGGIGEFGMLPGLLTISLMAGLNSEKTQSPVRWGGLATIVVVLSLVVDPGTLGMIAITVLLFLAARPIIDRRSEISTRQVVPALLLAALLLAGLLLFNDSFRAVQGIVAGVWSPLGPASLLMQVTSGSGWIAGSVTMLLWGGFIWYTVLRAVRLLVLDRRSAVWTFALILAVLLTLVLSSAYQPLIWLMAAVVVGRHSRVWRVASFRKQVDLQS